MLPLTPILASPKDAAKKIRHRSKILKKLSTADKEDGTGNDKLESRVLVLGNTPTLLDERHAPLSQIVSGFRSAWNRTSPSDEYLWTCFSIRPKTVANQSQSQPGVNQDPIKLSISSRGLGPTAFAYKNANGCAGQSEGNGPNQMCKVFAGEGGGWTKDFACWQPVLELSLGPREEVIAARVPVGLVQQAGNTVEGMIIVQEPLQKPQEIPLRVERPADPFNTGLQWFAGIALPALVSFGLGYGASKLNTKLSSRTDQQKSFTDFKDDEYGVLDAFFTTFYPAAYMTYPNDETKRARELVKEMRSKGILRHIPHKERKKLEQALESCKEEQIKKKLLELFKDWKAEIEQPNQGQDAGGG
jgi:hypothetical protein